MSALPKVCIIGAGSSGIAVVKALKDRGVPYDCFEKSDQIGGNWCFRNKNGMSAAYESLHINTDSRLMEYRDYPMPAATPDYPSHRVIMDYFNDYVDHFGLRETITFETGVEHARRRGDGLWEVALDSGEVRPYDALIVANGHHWDPRWPDPAYPGEFGGVQIHSHDYLTPGDPVDCEGKRVLIVGMGNSAMDIACELSRPGLAAQVCLSARHGVWVVPKYMFGKPTTRLTAMPGWVPWRLNSWLTHHLLSLQVGKPWDYGLPKPDHRILQAHPTISHEIFIRLGSGDIKPMPGVAALAGDKVRFTDGREAPFDVIIWCTGYKVSFPFFDPDFLAVRDNDLPLYHRLVRPEIDNLYFVGLLQPLGAIMPVAEAQGKYIARHLAGEIHLPSADEMRGAMEKERRAMFARYADRAPRHTMQVDFLPYLNQLRRIDARGERLRRRGEGQPPPSARAEGVALAARTDRPARAAS